MKNDNGAQNGWDNSTLIERFELSDELALFRVQPDEPLFAFRPGQYTVIGLPGSAARDLLLLYTDGVTDAQSSGGVLWGLDRLRATLAEIDNQDPMLLRNGVIKRLREWTGGLLEHDDVTLMAIQLDEHGEVNVE